MTAFQATGFERRPPSCPRCFKLMKRERQAGIEVWVCHCSPSVTIKQFAASPWTEVADLISEAAKRNLDIAGELMDRGEKVDAAAWARALANNIVAALEAEYDIARRVIQ